MYVGVCVYLYYIYVCGCMHVWRTCMGTCVSVLGVCVDFSSLSGCFFACYSVLDSFVRSELGNRRCGVVPAMDLTQEIRTSIHETIRRSVPVRVVKTIRRFESETTSFHVSVLCFLIEYFDIILRECF